MVPLPLLIEALALLLLDPGLDPGCHVVTQLGQRLVLRRGQAAVVLRRLRAREGLELAALGATHCGVLHDVVVCRWKQQKHLSLVQILMFSTENDGLCGSSWPETMLWLSWREFISLLNLCWAEQRLHRYLATFDLSVRKVYFFLLALISITNLRLCRNTKVH